MTKRPLIQLYSEEVLDIKRMYAFAENPDFKQYILWNLKGKLGIMLMDYLEKEKISEISLRYFITELKLDNSVTIRYNLQLFTKEEENGE